MSSPAASSSSPRLRRLSTNSSVKSTAPSLSKASQARSARSSRTRRARHDRWRPPDFSTSRTMHQAFAVPGYATVSRDYFPTTDLLKHPFTMTSELTINVHDLPQILGTRDVHRLFSRYGNIEHISLPAHDQGKHHAKIRFSPNPFHGITPQILPLPRFKNFTMSSGHSISARLEVPTSSRPPPLKADWYLTGAPGAERLNVRAASISFGFRRSASQIHMVHTVEGSDVLFDMEISRGRRQLKLTFPATSNGQPRYCRLEIPMQHMVDIEQTLDSGTSFDYIVSLRSPPLMWHRDANGPASFTHAQNSWNADHLWIRGTDIISGGSDINQTPLTIACDRSIIKLGTWLTYRIIFTKAQVPARLSAAMQRTLSDNNIPVQRVNLSVSHGNAESMWDLIERPLKDAAASSWLSELMSAAPPLGFEVRYQLEVCLTQGCFSEYNVTSKFIEKLNEIPGTEAIRRLSYLADSDQHLYDPMDLFSMTVPALHAHGKIPSYCTLLRSITVTPTHVYVSSPTVEMSNRIIRQYSEHQDRFLRVRFTDERSEGRLWARPDGSSDAILERVRRVLLHGLVIGGRHYDFLASGNSQFRDHGAYFFSPNASTDAQKIRSWIGELKVIRSVPKYISRMGQCFATTRAINSSKVELKLIHDVTVPKKNGMGEWNFTDGVGKISKFLAQMIATELRLHDPNDPPSLFQFRLGGCKGVLAIAPDAAGRQIHIRESQYKFAAIHQGLEIIRCSSFSCADLNRQLITILTCLGVPAEVFLRKVRKQIQDISDAIEQPRKAIDLLRHRIDQNQMTLQIATIIVDGFLEAHDPFAHSILDLWRSWSLKRLKEKARIEIEDGAFVLGCTDETKKLRGHFEPTFEKRRADITRESKKQGKDISRLPQIFLQVSDLDNPGKYIIIKGICILARNPSLEPGDIRVVMAVDIPELHHLKNVVAFPQTGDRDLPSMCSGGDLDGDDYFVSWDPELIPPEWNHRPGEFPAPTPIMKDAIGVQDLAGFYIDYMRNDNLGRIANQWQAIADKDRDGAKSPRCRLLARLHSEAVDFVKSGHPAILDPKLKPSLWPHFMPSKYRPPSQIYHSESVLGRLYDEVQTREYLPHLDRPFDSRVLGAFEQDQAMLKEARALKDDYDTAIRRIMKQHEIATEFEVWTAFCLEHNLVSGDYKFQEQLGELSATLKERYQDLCIEKAGSKEFEKLAPFVAAMYTITAEETWEVLAGLTAEERKDSRRLPFISFPWLFPDVLGKIARGSDRPAQEQAKVAHIAQAATERTSRSKAPVLIDLEGQDIEVPSGTVHADELLDLDFAFGGDSAAQAQTKSYHTLREPIDGPGVDSVASGEHAETEVIPVPEAIDAHQLPLRPKSKATPMAGDSLPRGPADQTDGEGKPAGPTSGGASPVAPTNEELKSIDRNKEELEAVHQTNKDDSDSDSDGYTAGEVTIDFGKKRSAFDSLHETVGRDRYPS